MNARHAVLLAAGFLVALGARASADRVGAEAHYGIAQKNREKGELDAAEASLRKAIEEDDTFLPARLALGEALLARGNVKEGLVEVRAAGELAADAAAASAWPADVARAKKRLQELDATASALAAKVEKHVADCLALAARWAEKDPDLARNTLQRVLRIVPGHAEATERLRNLTPEPQGELTPLFLSHEGNESFGLMEGWKVEDGNVSAASGQNGGGIWLPKKVSGDFDLRADARLVKAIAHPQTVGLAVIHAVGDISSFCYVQGRLKWEELTPTRMTVVFDREASALGYDPAVWTPLEMRFRGNRAEGWLHGKRVCEVERRNPEGAVMVGLRWQAAQIEFRRPELFVPAPR